jgi:hypothetical protein
MHNIGLYTLSNYATQLYTTVTPFSTFLSSLLARTFIGHTHCYLSMTLIIVAHCY